MRLCVSYLSYIDIYFIIYLSLKYNLKEIYDDLSLFPRSSLPHINGR